MSPLHEFMTTLVADRLGEGITDDVLTRSSEIIIDNAKLSSYTIAKNKLKYRRCHSLNLNNLQQRRDRFADINPVGTLLRSQSLDECCPTYTCSPSSPIGSFYSSDEDSSCEPFSPLRRQTRVLQPSRHSPKNDILPRIPRTLSAPSSCRWESPGDSIGNSMAASSSMMSMATITSPQRCGNAVWNRRGGGTAAPMMMMPKIPTRSRDSPTPPSVNSRKSLDQQQKASSPHTLIPDDRGQDLVATIKMLSFRAAITLTKKGGPIWAPKQQNTENNIGGRSEEQKMEGQGQDILSVNNNNKTDTDNAKYNMKNDHQKQPKGGRIVPKAA